MKEVLYIYIYLLIAGTGPAHLIQPISIFVDQGHCIPTCWANADLMNELPSLQPMSDGHGIVAI